MTTTCATCPRPVPGTEYGCAHCARVTADRLAAIADLASAARDVAARQTRRGPAIGGTGGGSRLPLNLAAAARLDSATNAITTWARHVAETRGVPVGPSSVHGAGRTGPAEYPGMGQTLSGHLSGSLETAARCLVDHIEYARHQPFWDELHADVAAAERVLRGVVDGPGERELVGACPCGTALYARPGRAVVTCPDCGAEWGTVESRQILIRHMEGMLLTAAEIAGLAVIQDPERQRDKVRKLINMWTGRTREKGGLDPAGATADGDPTYRVGEVLARLADAERWRERRNVITRDTVASGTTSVSTAGSAA